LGGICEFLCKLVDFLSFCITEFFTVLEKVNVKSEIVIMSEICMKIRIARGFSLSRLLVEFRIDTVWDFQIVIG